MARIGAGTSRGCRTCRRRKVKCDERKPGCERCENGMLKCEGYVREHRFVNENEKAERSVKKATKSQVSASPKSQLSLSMDGSSRRAVLLASNFSKENFSTMDLRGFEEDVFICFMLKNLFSGFPTTWPWMKQHLQDVASISAQKSIRALGAAYFGRIYHQKEITGQALALYGQALVSLNNDLQDKEKAWSMSVLRTAMALEFYEFIAFTSSSGWLKHAGGIARLIELRGPYRHQDPEARIFLQDNRVTIVLECLQERKSCFLGEPEWLMVPWELDPESKTLMLQLHDIFCIIPGLMESASRYDALLPAQQFFVEQMFLTNFDKLCEWRITWVAGNPDACWECPSREKNSPFPTILHFKSLSTANETTFYNAVLLLFSRIRSQIYGCGFTAPQPSYLKVPSLPSPLLLPGNGIGAREVAIAICRSVEYHLQGSVINAGAFLLLFPLRVAYLAFDDCAKERVWLSGMMNKIADASGWEISRRLNRTGFDSPLSAI